MKDNQIKFRVWNVEKEKYLTQSLENGWLFLRSGEGAYIQLSNPFMEHTGYILEQYLKVKDKNGLELYEGDFYKREDDGKCYLASFHTHPSSQDNFLIVGNYNIDGFDL